MAETTFGTILKYTDGSVTVGSLTSIGGVELTRGTVNVTTHQSTNRYQEYIGGLRDAAEFAVEGIMSPGDAGQTAILTHFNSDTDGGVEAMAITFPDGSEWTFNAICTRVSIGAAPLEGAVPFAASFKITGQPVFTTA